MIRLITPTHDRHYQLQKWFIVVLMAMVAVFFFAACSGSSPSLKGSEGVTVDLASPEGLRLFHGGSSQRWVAAPTAKEVFDATSCTAQDRELVGVLRDTDGRVVYELCGPTDEERTDILSNAQSLDRFCKSVFALPFAHVDGTLVTCGRRRV